MSSRVKKVSTSCDVQHQSQTRKIRVNADNSPGTNSTKNEDGMNVSGKKAAGNLSERKVDVHVMTGRTDPSSSRERICPHISLQVMKGDAGSGSAPCAPRTVAAFPAGRGLQGSPAETRRSF